MGRPQASAVLDDLLRRAAVIRRADQSLQDGHVAEPLGVGEAEYPEMLLGGRAEARLAEYLGVSGQGDRPG